ncbi:MAG: hypothetical protein A2Z21_05660 [Candidatus Fraserbacteria bacterium RBG_16_55_9]|uniref:SGNH hydrolase-type esterase domain-containing protein n=1 Tax=Fraserbacteria sp. (strain RBG_16_55_9) TaxID=1817864 RepID=A0A1F5UPK0_FRAXR|nr:MAG: hypothetical protein A2Z21_05660 [Candidatus Fraserbacteria bacterium RBG_16_55_9]
MRANANWSRCKFGISGFIALTLLSWGATSSLGASNCSGTSVGFAPITDLGTATYQGFQGGLYPNGLNARPEGHEQAGLAISQAIQPLNRAGRPSVQSGAIVLLSIGMSNTTQEFSTFMSMANGQPDKNAKLTIIDGAQGGQSADKIANPSAQFWTVIDRRLSNAGVTPQQVQIAWIKEADARPTLSFPEDAQKLQRELKTIAQILKQRFPNIQLAYLSSRTYGGYASTDLNPEPYAYQSGFAVKWLIEEQVNGASDLNYDRTKGEVKAPWLSWGPYLWADGLKARSDGLIWECSDFRDDGTHPSDSGRMKVAQLLLNFFKSDATSRAWFLKSP